MCAHFIAFSHFFPHLSRYCESQRFHIISFLIKFKSLMRFEPGTFRSRDRWHTSVPTCLPTVWKVWNLYILFKKVQNLFSKMKLFKNWNLEKAFKFSIIKTFPDMKTPPTSRLWNHIVVSIWIFISLFLVRFCTM